MEPKWDGIRLLAFVREDGVVSFYTRDGNLKSLPRIAKELAQLPVGTVLDGEAVFLREQEELIVCDCPAANGAVQTGDDRYLNYVVFDILRIGDLSVVTTPLSSRRQVLEDDVFGSYQFEKVWLTPQFYPEPDGTTVFNRLVSMGFEGTVVKKKNARYAQGQRGHGWTKIKFEATEDVIVTGYEPGRDVGAVVFSQYDRSGNLVRRGTCKAIRGLHKNVEELIRRRQVIEVKYNGKLPSGALRHPQFVKLRDDKAAEECVI